MSKSVLREGDEGVELIIRDPKRKRTGNRVKAAVTGRAPVHVLYGGADRFKAGTTRKLGRIALECLDANAPDLITFGTAFGFLADDTPRRNSRSEKQLEDLYSTNAEALRSKDLSAWLAAAVRERTIKKLRHEPIEDFRIDFEDGYGFRPDTEEDADAERCAGELATAFANGSITPFSGFRIKSYVSETRKRARRTLNIFLNEFFEKTNSKLPPNFVITLPKITDKQEVSALCRDLKKIEKNAGIRAGSVKIELMIEHPLALIDRKGNFALRSLVEASGGRCVAAHFGAYDHSAALGISALNQDITHPACDYARQLMLVALKPIGIRLSDSVTTLLPVAIHKGEKLNHKQRSENRTSIIGGWREHFANVRRSMANGFFQSWDLHPNQLVARYAATYSFFLGSANAQGTRLRAFLEKATKATLTGNTFDDAASAMGIVNFFRQGLDCGAFFESEVKQATGLSAIEVRSGTFKEIEGIGKAAEAEPILHLT